MSNFPPIEEIDKDIATGGDEFGQGDDFLSREKAVLGDDAEAFGSEPADSEAHAFESAFPEVENVPLDSGVVTESSAPYMPGQPDLATETEQKLSLEESEATKEWKARRELEIQRRDEFSRSKEEETKKNAEKARNDFYENYNSKQDELVATTEEEAKKFLEDRDGAIVGGTTWDRIGKIITAIDRELKPGSRDTTRFKEIVTSLQGDADAPGAAGY